MLKLTEGPSKFINLTAQRCWWFFCLLISQTNKTKQNFPQTNKKHKEMRGMLENRLVSALPSGLCVFLAAICFCESRSLSLFTALKQSWSKTTLIAVPVVSFSPAFSSPLVPFIWHLALISCFFFFFFGQQVSHHCSLPLTDSQLSYCQGSLMMPMDCPMLPKSQFNLTSSCSNGSQ